MNWFKRLFSRKSACDVAQEMRYEAERLALEYEAAAEHYAAMAAMYKSRVERLHKQTWIPSRRDMEMAIKGRV